MVATCGENELGILFTMWVSSISSMLCNVLEAVIFFLGIRLNIGIL